MSATPKSELFNIARALNINQFYREIHGAPLDKGDIVSSVLAAQELKSTKAVLVGDSETDLKAAEHNGVTFVLRRTPYNSSAIWNNCELYFSELR